MPSMQKLRFSQKRPQCQRLDESPASREGKRRDCSRRALLLYAPPATGTLCAQDALIFEVRLDTPIWLRSGSLPTTTKSYHLASNHYRSSKPAPSERTLQRKHPIGFALGGIRATGFAQELPEDGIGNTFTADGNHKDVGIGPSKLMHRNILRVRSIKTTKSSHLETSWGRKQPKESKSRAYLLTKR